MLVDNTLNSRTQGGNTKELKKLICQENICFESRLKASLAARKTTTPLRLNFSGENSAVKRFIERYVLPVISLRYEGQVVVAL